MITGVGPNFGPSTICCVMKLVQLHTKAIQNVEPRNKL